MSGNRVGENLTRGYQEKEKTRVLVSEDVPLLRRIDVAFPRLMRRVASSSVVTKEKLSKVVIGRMTMRAIVMARCPRCHPRCHQRHCRQRHRLSMWGVNIQFVTMIP